MKLIQLDASAWVVEEEFYSALLPQLGSPEWHGRNLNALHDSLYGDTNEVEPPLRVLIAGAANLNPDLRDFLEQAIEVFVDAREQLDKDVALELI